MTSRYISTREVNFAGHLSKHRVGFDSSESHDAAKTRAREYVAKRGGFGLEFEPLEKHPECPWHVTATWHEPRTRTAKFVVSVLRWIGFMEWPTQQQP